MRSEYAANLALQQNHWAWQHGRYFYTPAPTRKKSPLIRDKQDRIVIRASIACFIVLLFII